MSKASSQSPQVEMNTLHFRSMKHTFSVDHWHCALKSSFLLIMAEVGVSEVIKDFFLFFFFLILVIVSISSGSVLSSKIELIIRVMFPSQGAAPSQPYSQKAFWGWDGVYGARVGVTGSLVFGGTCGSWLFSLGSASKHLLGPCQHPRPLPVHL